MLSRSTSALLLAAALGMGGVIGCQDNGNSTARTPGEKMEMKGKMLSEAGSTRQKGEAMYAEGQGKIAQGQTLINEGRTSEGQQLAADGQAEVHQAQAIIHQAEQLQNNAAAMPITTQPATPGGPGLSSPPAAPTTLPAQ